MITGRMPETLLKIWEKSETVSSMAVVWNNTDRARQSGVEDEETNHQTPLGAHDFLYRLFTFSALAAGSRG